MQDWVDKPFVIHIYDLTIYNFYEIIWHIKETFILYLVTIKVPTLIKKHFIIWAAKSELPFLGIDVVIMRYWVFLCVMKE